VYTLLAVLHESKRFPDDGNAVRRSFKLPARDHVREKASRTPFRINFNYALFLIGFFNTVIFLF